MGITTDINGCVDLLDHLEEYCKAVIGLQLGELTDVKLLTYGSWNTSRCLVPLFIPREEKQIL